MTKTNLNEIPLTKVFEQVGIKFCPKCRVGYIEKEQKDFIEQIGMCASCDHIATDLTAEEQYAN
jgi:hypothetical protein